MVHHCSFPIAGIQQKHLCQFRRLSKPHQSSKPIIICDWVEKTLMRPRHIAYLVFNVKEPLYMLNSLTGVSVRRVKMPAGLVASPRRFHVVLNRDHYRLNISSLKPVSPHANYDYDAKILSWKQHRTEHFVLRIVVALCQMFLLVGK